MRIGSVYLTKKNRIKWILVAFYHCTGGDGKPLVALKKSTNNNRIYVSYEELQKKFDLI